MNRRCTRLLSSLFFLVVYAACAQNNPKYSPGFYMYLKQQALYPEQIMYLNLQQSTCSDSLCRDTILLAKAACFYSLKDMTACGLVIDSIRKSNSFANQKDRETHISFLFFLNKKGALKKTLVTADTMQLFYRRSRIFLQMLNREKIILEKSDSLVLNESLVQNILTRYDHPPHKSPLLAGLLSAAIPGLGKLYAGYKYQAFSAFTTNAFFAAQAIEAGIKSGLKSGHFIYACSLFSVYYAGNIAGSVWAVKKKKRDHFNQIDNEITSYYSSLLGVSSN